MTLCAATNPFGASWGSDGTILYGQLDGIMRVSANGGTPELVIPTETPEQVHGPQMLPGGEWVLFTLTSATGPTRWDEAQIVVQSLESGERKILWEGGSDASYVPTGHLVYAIEDVLFALPFDLARLEVSGGPVPMVEGVRRALSPATNTATASYGFSDLGTLIYLPGSVGSRRILALADRNGAVEPLDVPPAEYLNARLSPDGSKLAVEILSDAGVAIWVYDLSGETAPQRLTLEGNNISPVWTPDGERITFASDRDGGGLYWKSANGSGAAELLVTAEEAEIPWSWTPDGEILALRNRNHIGMLSLGNSTTEVLVAGADAAQFSPDGQWVAYEGGTQGSGSEIFVQPFPLTGGIHQISRGGGDDPIWSLDGRELFYRRGSELIAVAVRATPVFEWSNPQALPISVPPANRQYDVMPDGQQFLITIPVDQSDSGEPARPQINIVLNWFEELKERVPVP